jgi:hypothetical protein
MVDLEQTKEKDTKSNTETADQPNSSLSVGYVDPASGEESADLFDAVDGNVIVKMFRGDAVTVYSLEADWAKINYGGKDGYTPLKNISFSKPETEEKAEKETEAKTEEKKEEKKEKETTKDSNDGNVRKQDISIDIDTSNQIVNLVYLTDRDGFRVVDPVQSYPSYNASSTTQEGYCNVWAVYIFSEPNKNSTKRETDMLYNGDPVKILGSIDNWYYIATDNGSNGELHGYVTKDSITLGHIEVQKINYSATQGKVKDGMTAWVNYSPSKTDNKEVLSGGHTFNIIGNANDYWYQISYNNGQTGWISYKMVDVW